jgi:chorismate synthase
MSGNTIGKVFRVTTFGESHGEAIGGVVDGCPAGMFLDMDILRRDLSRRRATTDLHSTARLEPDDPQFLSGLFEGMTTGSPIAFLIPNRVHDPSAYHAIRDSFRPGHGDFGWYMKYGHYDYRGGGRYSARETVARVVAGSIARQLLAHSGITIRAWVSAIGGVCLEGYGPYSAAEIDSSPLRCPDPAVAALMMKAIEEAAASGDTLGGVISCVAEGLPAGLGEPVFDKMEAELAKGMMSIPAAKGFETGAGFSAAAMRGSEHNDPFLVNEKNIVVTGSNHAGGTLGGVTSGNPLQFRVAFKPVSSLKRVTDTVSHAGENRQIDLTRGRHDVCVVPRAVPVAEAMAAIVMADMLLRNNSARIR